MVRVLENAKGEINPFTNPRISRKIKENTHKGEGNHENRKKSGLGLQSGY